MAMHVLSAILNIPISNHYQSNIIIYNNTDKIMKFNIKSQVCQFYSTGYSYNIFKKLKVKITIIITFNVSSHLLISASDSNSAAFLFA